MDDFNNLKLYLTDCIKKLIETISDILMDDFECFLLSVFDNGKTLDFSRNTRFVEVPGRGCKHKHFYTFTVRKSRTDTTIIGEKEVENLENLENVIMWAYNIAKS